MKEERRHFAVLALNWVNTCLKDDTSQFIVAKLLITLGAVQILCHTGITHFDSVGV